MHNLASVTDPALLVSIHRATFTRIEGLRKRVAETTIAEDRAKHAHKDAKIALEAAQMHLSTAVSDMLDEVNGVSKLPLFDTQTDAIARAEADPVAQKLLARMLDHGITHLNVLVVAGYTEDQRGELEEYLDALDERKESQAELLDPPTAPDFLAEVPVIPAEDIAPLVERLAREGLTLRADVVATFTLVQRDEIMTWLTACETVKAEKGAALVMEDLPSAPSYLVHPAELDTPKKGTRAPAPAVKPTAGPRPKTKRRSSSTFKNSPRVVKAKRGKGRKR